MPGLESHAATLRAHEAVASSLPAKSVSSPLSAPNLLINGDAETGSGSTDGINAGTPIPGWQETGPARANKYNIPGPFQQLADPGPSNPGINYLAGGPVNEFSQLAQMVQLNQSNNVIDSGQLRFVLSGWLGGIGDEDDSAIASVYFKNSQGELLSEARIGPISARQRGNLSGLLYAETSQLVPPNTRAAEVLVQFSSAAGYNNGAADNLSLVIYDDAPALVMLPPDLFRRALRHLDSLRGSPMAPGWNASARLSSVAYPLFRPDLGDSVAYYDIPVYTTTVGIAQRGATAFNPLAPAGFIVVSTGEHDFPIPPRSGLRHPLRFRRHPSHGRRTNGEGAPASARRAALFARCRPGHDDERVDAAPHRRRPEGCGSAPPEHQLRLAGPGSLLPDDPAR